MNTAALLCSVVFFVHHSPVQEGPIKVSPETKRYREGRFQLVEPPFSLKKVKSLIRTIRPDKDDNMRISETVWRRLSAEEKYTYCMLHGEDASQNCDAMPWIVDEEKKIFAYPPAIFDGNEAWSERQRKFLAQHRADLVRLTRATLRSKGRVGANVRSLVIEFNLNELIPDLVAIYARDRRDQDILSTLMILMVGGKYDPFMASQTYHKLYSENANYQSYVVANRANQDLTIERAMAFYRSRVR